MKDKYVDEQYGYWFEFGKHVDPEKGVVIIDIASSDQRMDIGPVGKAVAEVLMHEHNRVQRQLVDMAKAFDRASPSAFQAFWYGSPREGLGLNEAMAESPALCQLAWEIYCEDTQGDMHVADSWEELPEKVKEKYFREAMCAPYGAPRRDRTSTP